ncbi:A30.5L-like protein [Pigeonpox virus]|uniref:A30.5L-like protein n=1 Tax=Pigeonpox virus TaxID=10264 RepID=A0A068EL16_9POXV|nr:A30.5L-like protein [Pigeonpox virus]AID46702.1 A30.5L-like protein [Pigeonpox virus]WCL40143.1 A30.5L-like protein [Pigeonpox virus]
MYYQIVNLLTVYAKLIYISTISRILKTVYKYPIIHQE